jgi:hypothetical protein
VTRGRWDEHTGTYVDPYTGEVLPTWDDALDAIGEADEPLHVARSGGRFDAQGVLSGSKDAARCIGYLTKYLTKQVADCHQAATDAEHAHAARLAEALRYEPCSPRCANWLRYGIQPQNARPGLVPGSCKGKAHDRERLGYAGRRVLVSVEKLKHVQEVRADRTPIPGARAGPTIPGTAAGRKGPGLPEWPFTGGRLGGQGARDANDFECLPYPRDAGGADHAQRGTPGDSSPGQAAT